MATSQAKLHDVFLQRLLDLQKTADAVATSFQNTGPRKWYVPQSLTSLLPPDLTPPFDRTEINTNYGVVTADATNPGTIGDITSLQQQLAYVASEERAFRLRQAGPCRLLAHAHGRLKGHGNDNGVFYRVQVDAAASLKASN